MRSDFRAVMETANRPSIEMQILEEKRRSAALPLGFLELEKARGLNFMGCPPIHSTRFQFRRPQRNR
jgi:hypothetical protein